MRRLHPLSLAPLLVLLVWFAAGQWTDAGDEARAWLRLVAVLGLAACLPLPASRSHAVSYSTRMQWIGWVALAGVIAIS